MVWSIIAIACLGFLVAAAGWRVHAVIVVNLCACAVFIAIQLPSGASIGSTLLGLYLGLAILQVAYFVGLFLVAQSQVVGEPVVPVDAQLDEMSESDRAASMRRQAANQ